MITTKDLGSLNELMNLEGWMATKLGEYSSATNNPKLKKLFKAFMQNHIGAHATLLGYLQANQNKGGAK